ncbi:unnamed protein product [Rotaria sp. Silwood2]|nr:unnamed protein product [Rotaria sp. Silwood2]
MKISQIEKTRLCSEIAKTGRTVTDKIILLILDQDKQDEPIDILKLISKNQTIPEELQDKIKLSLDIRSMINIDPTLLDNSDNRLKPFIDGLENAIISKIINENILNAYKEIVKQTRCQTKNFPKVFDVFIDILNQDKNYAKFDFDILVCIALASESTQISELKHLENNLSNDNEMIRSWSFRGLRTAHEKGSYSSIFKKCCDNIIDKLQEKTKIKVDLDLDLFETIASLKFNDFNQIRDKPKDQWNRELLIFDIIKRLQIKEEQRSEFDHVWLQFENHMNNFVLFVEFRQAINALQHIPFDDAYNILSNSKNPLIDLKTKHLTIMINQRLVNKVEIKPRYIESLASIMISKFSFDICENFLNALENINNLREFEELLKFAETNKITKSDIYVEKRPISIFKRSLEIKFLGNQIETNDRIKLGFHLDRLLDQTWSFEKLNDLFKSFKELNNQNKVRHFMQVLDTLSHYTISSKDKENFLSILNNPAENWLTEINKIAIENNFSDNSQEKNSKGLVDEFISQNSHNEHLKHFTDKKLLEWIEKINNPSSTFLFSAKKYVDGFPLFNHSINRWTKGDILKWTNLVKENFEMCTDTENFIIEALAILSCLIVLNPNHERGRLLQVATDEGKSTIISVLAVFYALTGKTVDIITSSPVLAEIYAKEKVNLYSMFDLDCSHNNDKKVYLSGPKVCYKKKIVYGEVAQFQFDTLRTQYADLKTLGDRKYGVEIVDEVDSMLIDDSSKIARLASTISGMDQLQIIYHLLWNHLSFLQEKIIQLDSKMYLFYGKTNITQNQISLEYDDDNGIIIPIQDLKADIASTSDIHSYIRSFIEENITIPQNFVETQIPKGVDNAITALFYQENVHYIVHDGLIKPVDYYSTGIVHSSSNWSDGLHQFLQLKHNLKMTSETFTTNFLSNIGYFKKYGSNLCGLTGTLGSEKARQVLENVYNVDLVFIPSSRQKQHLSLPDIIVANETEWLKEICDSAINESNKEKGTLIICETIE